MTFRVGQKVCCVKADYQFNAPPPYPSVGTIATVSWVGVIEQWKHEDDGGLAIDLVEFPSPETEGWWRGYKAGDWRPIVERKTSIEIFTRMLNPENMDA